jgi:hypothetical protein
MISTRLPLPVLGSSKVSDYDVLDETKSSSPAMRVPHYLKGRTWRETVRNRRSPGKIRDWA